MEFRGGGAPLPAGTRGPRWGTRFALTPHMRAAAFGELTAFFPIEMDVPSRERPTMPAPRESGIRLRVERVPSSAATVDIVVCDLSRDPRSEAFTEDDVEEPVRPPATSTIRALK
jgi:hypothetical protein